MSSHEFEPNALDVASFAAAGARLDGQWPLRSMQRLTDLLCADTTAQDEMIGWRVDGECRKLGDYGAQTCLRLCFTTQLRLPCQRCLAPTAVPIAVDRYFYFVEGADLASRLDADAEDDVLALTPTLDLQVLVEDELLLALPLVACHEHCPKPLVFATDDQALDARARDSPFAVLATLRRRTR